MSDDFKLSVDIEADLSRLDNTLNAAEAKVAAAGQRMQRSLTGGGSGGYAGVSPIAGPQASPGSANVFTPSGATFYGGNLNAVGANVANVMQQDQVARQLRMQQAFRHAWGEEDNVMGSALGRFGLSMASPMTMALGAGALAINQTERMAAYGTQNFVNQRQMRTAQAESQLGTMYGAAEAYRAAGSALQNFQLPGVVGQIPGVNSAVQKVISYQAEKQFQKNGEINLNNLGAVAATMDAAAQARRGSLGAFGDYAGKAAQLQMDRTSIEAVYQQKLRAEGSRPANAWRTEVSGQLDRQGWVLDIQQNNAVNTMRLSGTQAMLGAMGMGTMSNILGIQNDLQSGLAMTPDVAGNKPARDAMRIAAGGKTVAALMGGMTPAQEFTPGMTDMGSGAIRSGSMRNQDVGVITALNDIAKKVGEMHPLITH